jgi:hypothetical protein
MGFARRLVLGALRALPRRAERRIRLADSTVAAPSPGAAHDLPAPRVLVLGIYLADRLHAAEHLVERFASSADLVVEQRWMALGGHAPNGRLGAVTVQVASAPQPKFMLLNQLLRPGDLDRSDFVVVCDDDVHVPHGFLPALIGHQLALDFAVAGPAGPGTATSTTRSRCAGRVAARTPDPLRRMRPAGLVQTGRRAPAAAVRREPAMWGFDFVWPEVIGRHGLAMGIVERAPDRPQPARRSGRVRQSRASTKRCHAISRRRRTCRWKRRSR